MQNQFFTCPLYSIWDSCSKSCTFSLPSRPPQSNDRFLLILHWMFPISMRLQLHTEKLKEFRQFGFAYFTFPLVPCHYYKQKSYQSYNPSLLQTVPSPSLSPAAFVWRTLCPCSTQCPSPSCSCSGTSFATTWPLIFSIRSAWKSNCYIFFFIIPRKGLSK